MKYGPVFDDLYVTTILTSPATLMVTSGSTITQYPVSAGLANIRIPFHPDPQIFDISRNSVSVIRKTEDPIDATISAYNFGTTSGFGYSN